MEESSQGRCSFPSFLLPSSMPLCRKQHTHCKLVTAVVHAFFSNARRWSPAVWTRDFSPFELTGAGPVASPVYLYIFYYCCFVHVTLFRLKEQKEIQRSVMFSLKQGRHCSVGSRPGPPNGRGPSHVCMEGARSHSGQRSAAATALQVLESLHIPSPMMAIYKLNC